MRLKPTDRDLQMNWLDYGLTGLASCLAVYSIGMGLGVPAIGTFFLTYVIIGTVVSYLMHKLLPPTLAHLDGYLYAAGAFSSIYYWRMLNEFVPEGGFPSTLRVAGFLCWMLLIGSFFMWRDPTVIFQAVPSIALFGLVGAWDTFASAPLAFFGFLLCFATLFARAHARTMMFHARSSGFDPEEDETVRKRQTLWEKLRNGPWRWMAGPEWALGSAAAIVLISVISAPLLQESVKGFSGFVQIRTPVTQTPDTIQTDPFNTSAAGVASVGNGPRRIGREPLFKMHLDEELYLRMRTYDQYTGRGWRLQPPFPERDQAFAAIRDPATYVSRGRDETEGNPDTTRVTFKAEFLVSGFNAVPCPGEISYLDDPSNYELKPDGTYLIVQGSQPPIISGGAWVPPPNAKLSNAGTGLPPVLTNANGSTRIPNRVRDLARQVTQNAKTDYEKAVAIKQEIERRAKYNLNARPIPDGVDPVEGFLFDIQEGYCDLFASSMVMMARAVGLPARYATGYFPITHDRDEDGAQVLHENEAHAWAELFFEGVGWVPFDATEGAEEVPGGGLGTATEDVPFFQRVWVKTLLLTLGGLLLLSLPFGFSYLTKLRTRGIDPHRRELGQLYGSFVRRLENQTGKPRRPSQTPSEYLATLSDVADGHMATLQVLNQKFVEALYSAPTPRPEFVNEIRTDLKTAEPIIKSIRRARQQAKPSDSLPKA